MVAWFLLLLWPGLNLAIPGQIPLETRKKGNSKDRGILLNFEGTKGLDDTRNLDFNFRIRTRKNWSEERGGLVMQF